jgi:hypothetical protein
MISWNVWSDVILISELVLGECRVKNGIFTTVVELVLKADCLEHDDNDDDDTLIMEGFLYDRE